MFKFHKKKAENYESQNKEIYTPRPLPKFAERGHIDLSSFITQEYSLLDPTYLQQKFQDCRDFLNSLIRTSDPYTLGSTLDGFVDSQVSFEKNLFHKECIYHEISAANINKARNVRKTELSDRVNTLKQEVSQTREELRELGSPKGKHVLRIGRFMLQLGLPVTIAALAADFYVNKYFVQSILFSKPDLLNILVICMCMLSDISLYAVSTSLSKASSNNSNEKRIQKILVGIFTGFFILSIITSIGLRIGTMNLSFGSYDADGNFIGKTTFTIAEWSLTILSSFCTALTGAVSFWASFDPEYWKEKMVNELTEKLKAKETVYLELRSELLALTEATNPLEADLERRKAAEENLKALSIGLKAHVRKLMAIQQEDASFTAAMGHSTAELIEKSRINNSPSNLISFSSAKKKGI